MQLFCRLGVILGDNPDRGDHLRSRLFIGLERQAAGLGKLAQEVNFVFASWMNCLQQGRRRAWWAGSEGYCTSK